MSLNISIIIASKGRKAKLERCIKSIFEAKLPDKFEIIIVNGSLKDELSHIALQHKQVRLIESNKKSKGALRNAGIKNANGEILYFLDDDVIVEPEIFENVQTIFSDPSVAIAGGPNLTPASNTFFQKCCGYVLSSPFGAWEMSKRYKKGERNDPANERSLSLCDLAVRRSTLESSGIIFNEHVNSNEENILLQELFYKGFNMVHSPDLVVWHDRRPDYLGFLKQIFIYGLGRMQNILILPRSFSIVFSLPAIFCLYLFSLVFFHSMINLLPLLLYFAADIFFSLYASIRNRNLFCFPALMLLFPSCHIAYGIGFLRGLIFERK